LDNQLHSLNQNYISCEYVVDTSNKAATTIYA